jgi:hypothetical protein
MQSVCPFAGRGWHEGLTGEELDQLSLARVHPMSSTDRSASAALALYFAVIVIIGVTIAGLAGIPLAPKAVRTSSTNTILEPALLPFPGR